MTKKERYRNFCTSHPAIPIFLQPFWLDAVAEKWDVCLLEKKKNIIAALPYCYKGTMLTKRIYLPNSSFYQSVVFNHEITEEERHQLSEQLFHKLPIVLKSYFKFLPEYSSIDLLKYGYTKEIYNTYFLHHQQSIQLSKHHNRQLQKSIRDLYRINESCNPEASYQLIAATYHRQKMKPRISLKELNGILTKSRKNMGGILFDCRDHQNNLLASILVAEDKQTMYYLFGGYNPEFKNSGAMTFLLYQTLQYAQQQEKDFNFCGSNKKSIADYFEGFGAKKISINIWKKSIL